MFPRVDLPWPIRFLYMTAVGANFGLWIPGRQFIPRPVYLLAGLSVAIFFEVFNMVEARRR